MATAIQQTPLYPHHISAGGTMVSFAGHWLPMHYGSQIQEHEAVRTNAGLFDVSHMTITDITGQDSAAFLRYLLTADIVRLSDTQALYSCCCNEQGGIIDDLIVYRLSDTHFRVISNGATRERVRQWFAAHAAGTMHIEAHDHLALVAVQGPQAVKRLSQWLDHAGFDSQALSTLKRFHCCDIGPFFIARTGYTGEDGVEIALPPEDAASLWQGLLSHGVVPAGLGARDTLRLEAGMSLYGNDLDEQHSPIESGIGWTVSLKDPERQFIGREALEEQKNNGADWTLQALELTGRGVLRQGYEVIHDSAMIGTITSGGFSPTLKKSIALARLSTAGLEACIRQNQARPDSDEQRCEVMIRGKAVTARFQTLPFYTPATAS